MARVSVLFITVLAVMTTFVSIVTQCFAIVLVVMILMIVLIPKCCGSGEGSEAGLWVGDCVVLFSGLQMHEVQGLQCIEDDRTERGVCASSGESRCHTDILGVQASAFRVASSGCRGSQWRVNSLSIWALLITQVLRIPSNPLILSPNPKAPDLRPSSINPKIP